MSKDKKKFRETKVGQFLSKTGIVDNLLDVVPDKGILGVVKNILVKDNTLPPVDKEQALKLLEMDIAEMEAVTRRWEADARSGSWLSSNVRPLTLIFITLVYTAGFFLEYELDNINQILLLIIGAYFGGRSFEKTRT
tara:strand:- start:10958 stop:11368 length:411 start_codon:yes stop_codon:yes gene_type:complete